MNGQKARTLRKNTQANFPNMPWEAHSKENEHSKMYFNYTTMQLEPIPVYTSVLGSCQKSLYKMAKKAYKDAKRGKRYEAVV